ncbi:hypothetical protein PILCRDRAFT_813048 [Piloderma croceum F 1598]|uniref:Uncharacterized protein n=1 Tax=Piloderma croceum (strain F 1598) TaxID=765440 RepID=A0A0C3GBQ5_PILCF|nr:hypothetical protein PILCRDRAFT_813048 [Piloderma croceum F 1598]
MSLVLVVWPNRPGLAPFTPPVTRSIPPRLHDSSLSRLRYTYADHRSRLFFPAYFRPFTTVDNVVACL